MPRCKKQSWTSWKPPRCPGRSFTNGKKDKILNDFFSASSVVSSHGPSAAAKEHEKRILESILPPDLRFLLYAFNFHFHEEKNSLEARLVVMVNVEKIHVLRHLIRGGPNASTFQSIQVSLEYLSVTFYGLSKTCVKYVNA